MTEPCPEPTERVLLIRPTFLRPHSRGELTLRSADPFEHPRLDPHYISDPRDVNTLVEGIKRSREIIAATALDPYRGGTIQPDEAIHTDEGLAKSGERGQSSKLAK